MNELTEEAIERELQEKGLNAPRLTPSHIDKTIARAQYHAFPDSCTTVCQLTLHNGYTVIGQEEDVKRSSVIQPVPARKTSTRPWGKKWPMPMPGIKFWYGRWKATC